MFAKHSRTSLVAAPKAAAFNNGLDALFAAVREVDSDEAEVKAEPKVTEEVIPQAPVNRVNGGDPVDSRILDITSKVILVTPFILTSYATCADSASHTGSSK